MSKNLSSKKGSIPWGQAAKDPLFCVRQERKQSKKRPGAWVKRASKTGDEETRACLENQFCDN